MYHKTDKGIVSQIGQNDYCTLPQPIMLIPFIHFFNKKINYVVYANFFFPKSSINFEMRQGVFQSSYMHSIKYLSRMRSVK